MHLQAGQTHKPASNPSHPAAPLIAQPCSACRALPTLHVFGFIPDHQVRPSIVRYRMPYLHATCAYGAHGSHQAPPHGEQRRCRGHRQSPGSQLLHHLGLFCSCHPNERVDICLLSYTRGPAERRLIVLLQDSLTRPPRSLRAEVTRSYQMTAAKETKMIHGRKQ